MSVVGALFGLLVGLVATLLLAHAQAVTFDTPRGKPC
jgi:hypothetical protein